MFNIGFKKPTPPEDYNHTFFRSYNANANLYTVQNGKQELRLKNARLFFTTEKRNFDFFVVATSPDPKNTKDKYLFPITPSMGLEW